jgi:hypothetical protein
MTLLQVSQAYCIPPIFFLLYFALQKIQYPKKFTYFTSLIVIENNIFPLAEYFNAVLRKISLPEKFDEEILMEGWKNHPISK